MLGAERFERSVATLAQAFETGVPIAPLTDEGALTVADAYAIQLALVERRRAAGRRVVGHKVGLTSQAMQRLLGVDQPDFGHLFDDMVLAEGEAIPVDRFIAPRIEPEIAFVLKEPLAGPGVGIIDCIRAVDFVLPAMEIIDSRIADWRVELADTVADNASCGAVVVGAQPTSLADVDLRLVGCNVLHNGKVAATGAGGAVLGNPLRALAWLANVLGRHGTTLEAGEVVISGSCTTALPVEPGDVFATEFASLGVVTASFDQEPV